MAEDQRMMVGENALLLDPTSGGASNRSPDAALEVSDRKRMRVEKYNRLERIAKKRLPLRKAPADHNKVGPELPKPLWDPKHTIFLSHSGKQKEFTRSLFNELKNACYLPFFDASDESSRKGEEWLSTMMDAVRQCRVAILVLTDDFFANSKWPMIELNELAKAKKALNPKLRILPLYLGFTHEQFNGKKMEWLSTWKKWKNNDKKIDLNEWEQSLSIIQKINPLTCKNGEGRDVVINRVVKAICGLVEPDVKFNVPENHSIQQLCESILNKMKDIAISTKYKVKVMGLYGTGGIGKTTITKAICNEKFSEYGGKVCHIELRYINSLEVETIMLKDLTRADPTTIANHHDKLYGLLTKHMKEQSVFLVLDNVQAHEVLEVTKYLEIGYDDKSVVLLTSRSQDILFQLHINERDCMEMPPLEHESALAVLSYYLGHKLINKDTIIDKYLEKCCFTKDISVDSSHNRSLEKQFMPLALKVLGSQIQRVTSEESNPQESMGKCLEKLRGEYRNKLLWEKKHPIFSILRLGYDALCLEDQFIFLDMALLWTPRWRNWRFESMYMMEWMCIVYKKTNEDMKECMNTLKRNGLLDSDYHHDQLKSIYIHDLYIDFAEAKAQEGPFAKRRFLIYKNGIDGPVELLKSPPKLCWYSLKRLIIRNNDAKRFTQAKFNFFSNVEVLYLSDCKELVEIDIGSLENLRSLEISGCDKLTMSKYHVNIFININFLQLSSCYGAFVPQLLKSSKNLQILTIHKCLNLENLTGISKTSILQKLYVLDCDDLIQLPQDLKALQRLKELNIIKCKNLTSIGDIQALKALKKMDASQCVNLKVLPEDMSGLEQLEELDVSGCEQLTSLGDIQALKALKKLDASQCVNLKVLPKDMSGLEQLEELDVSGCEHLTSLGDIQALKNLKKLDASRCVNVKVLPDNMSGLEQLEELDVSRCKQLTSLGDIQALNALKKLDASWCYNLEVLPDYMSGLRQLEELDVSECEQLTSLGDIQALNALKKLDASRCYNLEVLPDYMSGLRQLEELDVSGCEQLTSLGDIQALEALKKLDASECYNLEVFPNNMSGLRSLEELDISGCQQLISLGDIQALNALKKLDTSGCYNLDVLPDNMSGLRQLEELNVSGCEQLTSLGDIQALEALKKLDASECYNLEVLPNNMSGLRSLEELDISGCQQLISLGDIQALNALKKLDASLCYNLEVLPDYISALELLEELDVSGCEQLTNLGDIQALNALKKLDTSGCYNLEVLPDYMSGLRQLEELDISGCEQLTSLGDIQALKALKKLDASKCYNLEVLPNNMSGLRSLEELDISGCQQLISLGDIQALKALKKLDASECYNLEVLPDNMSGLRQLEELDVSGCEQLTSLGDIQALKTLKKLDASECYNLEVLPDNMSRLRSLEELDISGCQQLTSLGDIQALKALKKLDASQCVNLKVLPQDMSGLEQLEELDVSGCEQLTSLGDIQALKALRKLDASGCYNLELLPGNMSGLEQLEELNVSRCKQLTSLGVIQALKSLKKLDASWCYNLEVLPEDMSGFRQLEELKVSWCEQLTGLGDIQALKALKKLDASQCVNLKVLPDNMSGLEQLEELDVSGCKQLISLGDIQAMNALKKLDASCCYNLEVLPDNMSGLRQLEELKVFWCEQLTSLGDFQALKALKMLDASGCVNLKVLPDNMSGLEQLEELDVSRCKQLTSLGDIQALNALKKLDASWCYNLEVLPDFMSGLRQLEELDVSGCEQLTSLGDIQALNALKKLDASRCYNLEVLPEDMSGLRQLEELKVSCCKQLTSLGDIRASKALKKLDASSCYNLEVLPDNMSGLRQLEELKVFWCEQLTSLGDIQALEALKKLDASGCVNLKVLPDNMSGLEQLEELDVSRCKQLTSLGDIQALNALKKLDASCCYNLEVLPDYMSGLRQLEELDVSGCEQLTSLGDIQALKALKKLDASQCVNLMVLPEDMSGLEQLEELDVSGCEQLTSLGDIQALKALKKLDASGCYNLEVLPDNMSGLRQLEEFDVSRCKQLTSLGDTQALKALKKLDAIECVNLKVLPEDMSGLEQLEELNVSGCEQLTSLGDIQALNALKKLDASRCYNLEVLPDNMNGLRQLEELKVSGCEQLTSLGDIQALKALKKLDASGCYNLEVLPKDMSGLEQLEDLNGLDSVFSTELRESIKGLMAVTSSSKEGQLLVEAPSHGTKQIASDLFEDGIDMLDKDAIPIQQFQSETSTPFAIGEISLSPIWASLKRLLNIGLGGIGFARPGWGISFQLQSRDLPSTSLLGKGLAGIGYETTWKGARYARKDFFGVPKDIFLKEAPLLVSLEDHKNIVKTYGWTTDKRSCSLVLEYMDDDLVSLLQKRMNFNKVLGKQSSTSTPTPPFDLPQALYTMLQIATGVAYLHAKGLVHGDLKTKNILVSRMNGGDLKSKVVKVTDYGLVQTKRKSEFIVSRKVRQLDMIRWKAPECWGTQLMRQLNTSTNEDGTSSESDSESTPSPEVSFTASVTSAVDMFAADVYSFAMICSQLLTGTIPYPHKNWKELGRKILDGLRPDLRDTCHPKLRDLLVSCWGAPAKRPSFEIICSKLTLVQQSLNRFAMVKRPQEVAMPFNVATPLADRREVGASTDESSSSRLPSTSATSPTSDATVAAIASPGPTSSKGRIPQVSTALNIIENVQKILENVWVNKNQCQRVADRFRAIGQLLRMYITPADVDSTLYYPAFDELLRVLQKGQALVSSYVDQAAIKDLLTWGDNREAFKEIHEELESMKAKFPFDSFGDQFEIASWSQRAGIVTHDADQDLKAMKAMKSLPQSCPATELTELEQVVRVALERSGPLPSYLHIDLAKILIKDPVKVQVLRSPDAKLDGAVVCEGSWLSCDFAVKVFRSELFEWNKDQMLKEIGALVELRHPHIVRFIGFAQGPEFCAVLMELMPEKDLRHYMETHSLFTRSEELDIITQIAKGMLYLHTQGYVHGDLKCSNILVKKHKDYIEVKIGDLRYAQKLESVGGSSEFETVRRPRWSPPEALEKYGSVKPTDDLLRQADVYSFAMTCYEVVTGRWPFDGIRDRDGLKEKIKAGERPKLPADMRSELKGLIQSCWANDPNERPVFENICVILEFIRSCTPTVTNKSSGIANVGNAFKDIPNLLRAWHSEVQNPSTTWNKNTTGRSESGAGADGVIKLPECLKIKPRELKKVRRVCNGAITAVDEVIWLGCTFAMKRIKNVVNAASILDLQKELDFLIKLRHPYIIQLVGFSLDKKDRCSIVMEFMKGSLRELIDSRIEKSSAPWRTSNSGTVMLPFDEVEQVSIITKLALGMSYLHSRGVAHRNLKAPNVLSQVHGGFIHVKIVDFGVSQFIDDAERMVGVGTRYWRAPEILPTAVNRTRNYYRQAPEILPMTANRSNKYGVDLMAADVYSFAMTCYEIVTGLQPFELEFGSELSHYDEVVSGVRPELPSTVNEELQHLIVDCWQPDPARRPRFLEICTRLDAITPHK